MKKTFWGYSVDEVNENISYLESQIESLTAKLTSLRTELVAKDEKLAKLEGSTANQTQSMNTVNADVSALKSKISRLEEQNRKMMTENKQLSNENYDLKLQLSENGHDMSMSDDEIKKVGRICEDAYADMALAKKQTAEQMKNYISGFIDLTERNNEFIQNAVLKMQAAKDEAQTSFIAMAEEILSGFSQIENENFKLDSQIEYLEDIKEKLDRTLNEYLADNEDEKASKKVCEEEETVPFAPMLSRYLRDRKKSEKTEENEAPKGFESRRAYEQKNEETPVNAPEKPKRNAGVVSFSVRNSKAVK